MTAIVVVVVAAVGMTSCTAQGSSVTPEQARDALVKLIDESSALIPDADWTRLPPYATDCTASAGGPRSVSWVYVISAPPLEDHLADATTIAKYWEDQKLAVKLVTDPVPVVFASGGPTSSLSFSSAPGLYAIEATSACVPGDDLDYLPTGTNSPSSTP